VQQLQIPTGLTPGDIFLVLECLSDELPFPFLGVRRFLLWHGTKDRFPYSGDDGKECCDGGHGEAEGGKEGSYGLRSEGRIESEVETAEVVAGAYQRWIVSYEGR